MHLMAWAFRGVPYKHMHACIREIVNPWTEFGLYNDLYMGCLQSCITHKNEGHVL
jgi:hypothetical protein